LTCKREQAAAETEVANGTNETDEASSLGRLGKKNFVDGSREKQILHRYRQAVITRAAGKQVVGAGYGDLSGNQIETQARNIICQRAQRFGNEILDGTGEQNAGRKKDSRAVGKLNKNEQDTAHKLRAALSQRTAPRSGQIKEGKTSSTKRYKDNVFIKI
jgi:hypothetical protein